MAFGFQISTTPVEGGVNVTNFIMIAVFSALAYYIVRKITTNKYVALAIGVALALFGYGYLSLVGAGMLALGVSRLMEQEINTIVSS